MTLTVESLLAKAELDDSEFTQGLSRITQGLEQYDRRAAVLTARPTSITLDTSQALAQTGALTQNLVALERGVVDAVTTIIGSLTQGETSVEGFVAAIRQGAVEELTRLGASAEQTAAVLRGFDRLDAINVETDRAVANLTALDNAADTLLAKLGLVRREASTPIQLVTAGGGAPPELPPFDFTPLARGHEGALAAATELRLENERLLETMLQQGQAARKAGGDNAAAADLIAGSGDKQTRTFLAASGSAKDLTRSLGTLAVASLGAQGPVSRVALSFLPFLGVSLPVVAAGAAVALIYDRMTAAARKAAEATDGFIKTQVGVAQARNPFEQMLRQIQGVPGEIQGVTDRLRGLRTELALLQQQQEKSVIGDFGFAGFNARIAKAQAEIKNAETALLESARGFAEQVFTEIDRASQGLLAAQASAIQDGLSLEQQGFSLREAQLRLAFGQEEITRQQFTERRITLARQAAAAEVAALQAQQKSIVEGPTPRTDEASAAQRFRLEGLDRAIQLRQGELTIQEQQITAEAQLAAFTEARRQEMEEFAAAIESVQRALENLPVDRFRDLIESQQNAGRERLNFLPTPEVPGISGGFEDAARDAEELNDVLTAGAAASNQFFREAEAQAIKFQRALRDTRTASQRLNDSIHELTGGLDSIVGAAVNVGLIGDEAARSIGSVLDLGDAIGKVIEEASTGNILGLVGAGINLGGQLFGPSPVEVERNRILERNNELLEQNNARLAGVTTGRGVAGLSTTTDELLRNRTVLQRAQFDDGGGSIILRGSANKAREEFDRILAQSGTTAEEFAAQIKELTGGIEILDDKGRVVAKAFDQARTAIDQMVESITNFGTSLSEREEVLRTRDRLGLGPNAGLPPEDQDLARSRQILLSGLDLGAAWEEQIQGLDLGTEQGRAAFLAFIQMLFEMGEAGELTIEQLGLFEDVQELLGPINSAKDALDAFAENAEDAAERIGALNIPTVLRLDALRAQASIPEWRQVDTLANLGSPDLTNLGQRAAETFGLGEQSQSFDTLASRLGDIAPLQEFLQRIATETPDDLLSALETLSATIADRALPAGATTFIQGGEIVERRSETIERGPSVHIEYHGDPQIHIYAQPGQSPAEIAAAVREEFERHAMNDTGQIQRAGETLGGP